MIQAEPHGFINKTFDLREEGWPAGRLVHYLLPGRAEITVGSTHYRAYRKNLIGPFLLEKNGSIIARAVKPSIFLNRFILDLNQETYELRKLSLLKKTFVVKRRNEEVGRIDMKGIVSKKIEIDLPASWPLPVRAFAFWLALLIWIRENTY